MTVGFVWRRTSAVMKAFVVYTASTLPHPRFRRGDATSDLQASSAIILSIGRAVLAICVRPQAKESNVYRKVKAATRMSKVKRSCVSKPTRRRGSRGLEGPSQGDGCENVNCMKLSDGGRMESQMQ